MVSRISVHGQLVLSQKQQGRRMLGRREKEERAKQEIYSLEAHSGDPALPPRSHLLMAISYKLSVAKSTGKCSVCLIQSLPESPHL